MKASLKQEIQNEQGFTLIELLVAIGIIGILASIAIPLYSSYLENSMEARVKTDLRHIALAEEAYFVDNQVFRDCDQTNCATILPGVNSLSQGVTLAITASANGFTGTASHPQVSVTCQWDSEQGGLQGCT